MTDMKQVAELVAKWRLESAVARNDFGSDYMDGFADGLSKCLEELEKLLSKGDS